MVEARFSAHVQTGTVAYGASCTMVTGSISRATRRGVDHPPHLEQRLKKEYSYNFASLLGLHGLLQGELNVFLYSDTCCPKIQKFVTSFGWGSYACFSKKFSRLRLKCDDTHAETIFRLSGKRTSLFKSAGASVQSTTGSRGVRISGSNAGYTMF